MTRINVVPVTELCDQHLLAEHRELTRIPNAIANGKFDLKGQPQEYTLGKGHVKFFYDKLQYLYNRYLALNYECHCRGFNTKNIWDRACLDLPLKHWKDYKPTLHALVINRARIADRMPKKPRFTAYKEAA